MSFEDKVKILVNEEMNAVCFVMDYVEFRFNGPILRALSNPVLYALDTCVSFPSSGSRDALCGLIGSTVLDVRVTESESILLFFDEGRILKIPLSVPDLIESAHFVPGPDEPIDVYL